MYSSRSTRKIVRKSVCRTFSGFRTRRRNYFIEQEGGVQQTAIHKHLPDLSTPIWWTHIKGTGDPVEMAKTINNGPTKTETPMEAPGGGGAEGVDLNTEKLDKIIGHKGKIDNGVYKYSIGLIQSMTTEGVELPSAMGGRDCAGLPAVG